MTQSIFSANLYYFLEYVFEGPDLAKYMLNFNDVNSPIKVSGPICG